MWRRSGYTEYVPSPVVIPRKKKMMCSRSIFGLAVIITISILTLPFSAHAQFVSNLPDCVQNCIYSSQDDDCEITDIVCLCRASAGDFLPDLITCMHDSCDSELDDDLLLEPLKLACEIAGAPIPSAALQSAENEATSLATQVTKTETVTQPVTTTTVYPNSGSSSVETVTVTTTAAGGSTVYVAYPVTVWSKTTVTGSLSTVTIISTDTYILSATASPSTTNSASDAASTSDSRTTTSVECRVRS